MHDDGYTRFAAIECGDSGSVLRIEYRPMFSDERRSVQHRILNSDTKNGDRISAEAMARHIVAWNLDGSPSANVMHLLSDKDPDLADQIFSVLCGVSDAASEADDARNLVEGLQLQILHPMIAIRSCEDCQEWFYDEGSGKIFQRAGQPVKRMPGTLLCELPKGCPKGTPENQRALNVRNQRAFRHYQESRAIGQFPDDPIVRRNARLIRDFEDKSQRDTEERRHRETQGLFNAAG